MENPLIWHGVLHTVTCQVAYRTPPFGYTLFLMRVMWAEVASLAEIDRAIVPIVMIMMVTQGIPMVFPEIAVWLPQQFRRRSASSSRSAIASTGTGAARPTCG